MLNKDKNKFFQIIYAIRKDRFFSKINIKLLCTSISLAFVGYSVYINIDNLKNESISTGGFFWLLCAIIFAILSIFINAFAWKLLLKSLNYNLHEIDLVKLFVNTNIYKYLPGGIWHFVSRVKSLRKYLSLDKALESVILEPLLMLVAALIIIPLGEDNIFINIISILSPIILLPKFRGLVLDKLVSTKKKIFDNIDLNNKSGVILKKELTNNIDYPIKALFVEILFITTRFFCFYCCLCALSIGDDIALSKQLSAFSFSWVVGLLVPAAPGGMGVFEATILLKLGGQVSQAPFLISLLSFRLISTLADILSLTIIPCKKFFIKKIFI